MANNNLTTTQPAGRVTQIPTLDGGSLDIEIMTGGGGGGGGGVRLPGIAYVDASNPQATPDGTIANPFVTVNDAVAAVLADGVGYSSILVFPGDYSGEPAIVWGGGISVLFAAANNASRMWQGSVPLASLPDLTFNFSQTQFNGVEVGQLTDSGGVGIIMTNCNVRNAHAVTSNGGVISMDNCSTQQGVAIRGANARFRDCELGDLFACSVTGTLILMQGCTFDGSTYTFESFFASPGLFTIDGWSKALLAPIAPTLNNIAYDLQNALA